MLKIIHAALNLDAPDRNGIWKKLTTGLLHPIKTYQVAVPRVLDYLARKELIRKGFEKEVKAIEERYQKNEIVGQPWAELRNLVMLAKKYKARHILEFGSGRSTILFGAVTKITSIDADEKWVEINNKYLPKDSKAEIIYSPVRTEEYEGDKVLYHENIPDISPDFIYLDGPAFQYVSPGCSIAADIVKMNLKKGTVIIVDGRKKNTAFLKKHLKYEKFWEITGLPFGQGFSQPCFQI